MGDWKMVLMEQRAKQLMCWFEPFVKLRAPKMFNLRRDPFERADENSNTYWDWVISHAYLLYGMQALVAQQIEAFHAISAASEAGRIQSGRGAATDPGRVRQQQSLARDRLAALSESVNHALKQRGASVLNQKFAMSNLSLRGPRAKRGGNKQSTATQARSTGLLRFARNDDVLRRGRIGFGH